MVGMDCLALLFACHYVALLKKFGLYVFLVYLNICKSCLMHCFYNVFNAMFHLVLYVLQLFQCLFLFPLLLQPNGASVCKSYLINKWYVVYVGE